MLIVADEQAADNPALAAVTFDTEVTGGEVQPRADGGFVVVDDNGVPALVSPTPLMWDSSGEADPVGALAGEHAPGEGDQVAVIDTIVAADEIVLSPDAGLLSSADTEFPVFIDPTVGAYRLSVAMVNQRFPHVAYPGWGPEGHEGMGWNNYFGDGPHVKRLFYKFDTDFLHGKVISAATFKAFETFAYSCTRTTVALKTTRGWGAHPTWNTQPAVVDHIDSVVAAHGRENCDPGGKWVEFDATAAAIDVVQGTLGDISFMLRAADESDPHGWKRFKYDAVFSVTYNSRPNVPHSLAVQSPSAPCGVAPNEPVTGDNTPTLTARGSDPDGGNLQVRFELWIHTGPRQVVVDTPFLPSGSLFTAPIQPLVSAPYSWRARAHDGGNVSAWSGWCQFTVDTVAPRRPPLVSSTGYPEETLAGVVGVPGEFVFDADGVADVSRFLWGVNVDTPTTSVNATTLGGAATVMFTPSEFGPNVLTVRSVDRAGNYGPVRSYTFRVDGGAESGWWKLDETSGTAAADSVAGQTATLTGGTWTAGRWSDTDATDGAVLLDGVDDGLATAAPVLDTARSFSVSAWVRTTDPAARQVAVSQDGTAVSGFWLGYDPVSQRFVFERAAADSAAAPGWVRVSSTGPAVLDTWVHLGPVNQRHAHFRVEVLGSPCSSTRRGSRVW